MMTARIQALMAVLLVATGGCGPGSYWYQPGRTLEQAKTDFCDCRRQARLEASAAVMAKYRERLDSPVLPPTLYVIPDDDSIGGDPIAEMTEIHEHNFLAGCMKQRGYQPARSHRVPSSARTHSFSEGAVAGQ
jgi:hypothetical protein